MRLCFMTFACPEWTLDDVLGAAVRHGYQGVEPRVMAHHKHGIEPTMPPAARRQARAAVDAAGVPIGCIATSCRFSAADPRQRAANVDELKRHISLAADLGAPRLRVFGGRRPEGLDLDAAVAIVSEDLLACADLAASAGVQVCLETHDDFSLGKTVGRVLARANHPFLLANWDVMHPHRAGEPLAETLEWLRGRIAHVHVHDHRDGKAALPGDGDLPLADDLAALRGMNFDGYLSAELWPDVGDPDHILGEYARRMRSLIAP